MFSSGLYITHRLETDIVVTGVTGVVTDLCYKYIFQMVFAM